MSRLLSKHLAYLIRLPYPGNFLQICPKSVYNKFTKIFNSSKSLPNQTHFPVKKLKKESLRTQFENVCIINLVFPMISFPKRNTHPFNTTHIEIHLKFT